MRTAQSSQPQKAAHFGITRGAWIMGRIWRVPPLSVSQNEWLSGVRTCSCACSVSRQPLNTAGAPDGPLHLREVTKPDFTPYSND